MKKNHKNYRKTKKYKRKYTNKQNKKYYKKSLRNNKNKTKKQNTIKHKTNKQNTNKLSKINNNKLVKQLNTLKKFRLIKQNGGLFPKDLIDSATKKISSKISSYDTSQLSINQNDGYFSTLTNSSIEFIKKLNIYFLVMILSFGNELFEMILPDSQNFQNASIDDIKKHFFKSSNFFNVMTKLLSDEEFINKWKSMFEEFYNKLLKPILEGGAQTLEGQIHVYEQVLENIMYRFSKSVLLGLWDGISGALDIIPGAGTVIGVIEIIQMLLQSMIALIKSLRGPVKFIVDMSDLLGEIGAPLRDTIETIEDIYNSFREIYDTAISPITDVETGIQSMNNRPNYNYRVSV